MHGMRPDCSRHGNVLAWFAVTPPTAVVLITRGLAGLETGDVSLLLLDISDEFSLIHRPGIETHLFGNCPDCIHMHIRSFLLRICVQTIVFAVPFGAMVENLFCGVNGPRWIENLRG
jgi:hypothetical protein